MDVEELIAWGECHHYPQLVLGEKDVLRHGSEEWLALLQGTEERIERALERVRRWQEREGQPHENQ